jgi:hypothetical protein
LTSKPLGIWKNTSTYFPTININIMERKLLLVMTHPNWFPDVAMLLLATPSLEKVFMFQEWDQIFFLYIVSLTPIKRWSFGQIDGLSRT